MNEIPEIQNDIATRIAGSAKAADDQFSIDPFTIMAILNCIIALVKLLYMCYSKESMMKYMVNHESVVHKFLLKREIRKHFSTKEDRKAVYGAVLEVSKNMIKEEKEKLIDSIIGGK